MSPQTQIAAAGLDSQRRRNDLMKAGAGVTLAPIDQRYTRPFVAVSPEDVAELGPEAAIVLAHLDYLTRRDPVSGVIATAAQIAAGTGLGARTVQRATTRLRERGLLASERASTWDPTQRWTVAVSAGRTVTANLASTSLPDQVVSLTAKMAVTPSLSEVEEIPPLAPQGGQDELTLLSVVPDPQSAKPAPDRYEAEFQPLWLSWPLTRRGGRPRALRYYRAARKRGVSYETISAGFARHVPVMHAKVAAGKHEGDYVPHVSSWLNNDGWDQEPPSMPRAPRGNPFADPHLLDQPATNLWSTP